MSAAFASLFYLWLFFIIAILLVGTESLHTHRHKHTQTHTYIHTPHTAHTHLHTPHTAHTHVHTHIHMHTSLSTFRCHPLQFSDSGVPKEDQ